MERKIIFHENHLVGFYQKQNQKVKGKNNHYEKYDGIKDFDQLLELEHGKIGLTFL